MNTLIEYPIPQWIAIAFLCAIPAPFILILLLLRKEDKNPSPFPLWIKTLVFFTLYLSYIGFASAQGWFNSIMVPPKVLLLTTFPYGFFLFVVVLNTKAIKNIIEKVSLESIVKLHIFRLIGVFFILLALHDSLPKPFAFIAGFGDILTAIASIFVAKALRNKKSYARKLTLFWNIFGTIDILFTAIAANVLAKIAMDTGAMGVDTLARFPFCIIPAFAPPTILFLHWIVFLKMKKKGT